METISIEKEQTTGERQQVNLVQKYDVPASRYTSYPTVPYWDKEAPTSKQWFEVVERTYSE